MKNKWRNLFIAVLICVVVGVVLSYLNGEGARIVGNEKIAVAIALIGGAIPFYNLFIGPKNRGGKRK